jgi:hypothetical protein
MSLKSSGKVTFHEGNILLNPALLGKGVVFQSALFSTAYKTMSALEILHCSIGHGAQ